MKPLVKLGLAAAATAMTTLSMAAAPAAAQQDCMIGEVKMFAGNFAPRGWATTDGQLLSISSNTALFSILGTIYGGDGRTTFGLPDLRGRSPIGEGQGPGLSNRRLGERTGAETVTARSIGITTQPGSDPVDIGGVPVNNMQPSLGMNYIICLQGTYPSRS